MLWLSRMTGTVVAADLECDKITIPGNLSFGSLKASHPIEMPALKATDAVKIAELQAKYNALVTALNQMGIIYQHIGMS